VSGLTAKRCAAICGLLLALAGCGTPATPPQAATGAPTAQETARSASPSPTGCEDPCTTTRTSTPPASANATATAARGAHPTKPPSASAPTAIPKSVGSTTPPPYSRDEFGTGWTDPDHNGCDARQDAIRAATTNRTTTGPCKITRADIHDRYTGRTYPGANPSAFDIDHVVALHDAWNSGAASWTRARRVAFANDPADVVLTTASANRSKGDQDPSEWAPASHDGACFYVRTYRAIKLRWRLHTTPAQRSAIRRTLATCTGTENR
jgi:hypothetical protein